MIKVYAASLALGALALIFIVLGGAVSEASSGKVRDPGLWIGSRGRIAVGGFLGFSMGGMAAEFSPLDFSWPVALIFALVGAVVGAFWVRYALSATED